MLILAGDIGGTKTLLELSQYKNGESIVLVEERYESSAFDQFSDVIENFIQKHEALIHHHKKIKNACFGVAGPIKKNENNTVSQVTNLPWILDSKKLSKQCNIKNIALINDFQAVGYGVSVLDKSDFQVLQQGQVIEQATCLVIGAGTGLGVAQLIWGNTAYQVLGTEGGHINFAPRNEVESALLNYLQLEIGHVACEDVLSGPGLVNIYRFLHTYRGGNPDVLESMLKEADAAASIAYQAEQELDILANEAVDIFVEIYGAIVGNFALSSMAVGGVYIAGGIAPKLIQRLKQPSFLTAFRDKGKMEKLMAMIPLAVIMNPDVGLIGSRYIAQNLSINVD